MNTHSLKLVLLATVVVTLAAVALTDRVSAIDEANNCSYFSPSQRAARTRALLQPHPASALTVKVANRLATVTNAQETTEAGTDTLDRHLFDTLAAAKVLPAQPCTDLEFIRRVTLDLTGCIPTPNGSKTFSATRRLTNARN